MCDPPPGGATVGIAQGGAGDLGAELTPRDADESACGGAFLGDETDVQDPSIQPDEKPQNLGREDAIWIPVAICLTAALTSVTLANNDAYMAASIGAVLMLVAGASALGYDDDQAVKLVEKLLKRALKGE